MQEIGYTGDGEAEKPHPGQWDSSEVSHSKKPCDTADWSTLEEVNPKSAVAKDAWKESPEKIQAVPETLSKGEMADYSTSFSPPSEIPQLPLISWISCHGSLGNAVPLWYRIEQEEWGEANSNRTGSAYTPLNITNMKTCFNIQYNSKFYQG